jgi:nucleoside-diphosphate-sugar epimerase
MKKVCITGVNGFIGKPLSKALIASGKKICGFTRTPYNQINSNQIEYVVIGDITKNINWRDYLKGYDCIIHCAGKAHSTNKNDKLDDYLSINTESTRVLAEEAVKAGVKRFVFLSSIKVNGKR